MADSSLKKMASGLFRASSLQLSYQKKLISVIEASTRCTQKSTSSSVGSTSEIRTTKSTLLVHSFQELAEMEQLCELFYERV